MTPADHTAVDPEITPRVCLVVPASEPRKVEKALASAADEVVLDLEDAVAPAAKDEARRFAAEVVARPRDGASVPPGQAGPSEPEQVAGSASPGPSATPGPSGPSGPVEPARTTRPTLAVRVNQVGTPWCHHDVLELVARTRVDLTLVLPKATPAGVAFLDGLVRGARAERETRGPAPRVRIDALVETADALRDLDATLTTGDLVRAVVVGYADLAADLGRDPQGEPSLWDPVRAQVVTAARAAGRALIDGPWLGTRADEAFVADLSRARAHGFDGTWVIHPAQVAAALGAFTPAAEEVAWARRVLAALDEAAARGAGAVELDGRMLDEALAVRARAVVARGGDAP